jgi:hypothetical protein
MKSRGKVFKQCICSLLLVLIASPLYGDFKIMGGVSISTYDVSTGSANIRWDYKIGFSGGIGLERNLNPYMLLELDILYFQKGSRSESSSAAESEAKHKLNVLSLPLLFRSKFLYDSSPYVVGGVEFSTILSHDIVYQGQEHIDIKSNTPGFDFGFVFGCGYEIKIEDHLFFFIEGRYHLGSRNLVANPLEEETKKSRAVLVLIGFRS